MSQVGVQSAMALVQNTITDYAADRPRRNQNPNMLYKDAIFWTIIAQSQTDSAQNGVAVTLQMTAAENFTDFSGENPIRKTFVVEVSSLSSFTSACIGEDIIRALRATDRLSTWDIVGEHYEQETDLYFYRMTITVLEV